MSRKTRPPTQAALIINEFLLSKEAGVKVTDVTYDALKKAYEKHFSQTEVEIIKKGRRDLPVKQTVSCRWMI